MFLKRLARLQNAEPSTDGGGSTEPSGFGSNGDLDLDTAVDEIGAGLGLEDRPEITEDPDNGQNRETPPATPAPTSAPVGTPAPTAAPSGTPAPPNLDKAPDTWTAAAQAKWQALDPAIRAEIHKREQDMFKGLDQYKGAATFARGIAEVVAPVLPELQRYQVTPQQFVSNLTQAHMAMSDSRVAPEQRAQMAVEYLKNSYGIDLTTALKAPAGGNEPEYVDPQVAGLQAQLKELQSRIEGTESRAVQEVHGKIAQTVEQFASDPAHQYFNEVADDIALLIRGSGGRMALKDAYEKAVFANPVTRAKEVARLHQEATAKATKEAQDRVAAAKKASQANVETRVHQTSGTAPTGSMDDTMEQTLAKINARK